MFEILNCFIENVRKRVKIQNRISSNLGVVPIELVKNVPGMILLLYSASIFL